LPSVGAVLDACVLIPFNLRDILLSAAEVDLYRLHWSETILDEMRRNLIHEGMTTGEQADHLLATMRTYFLRQPSPASRRSYHRRRARGIVQAPTAEY
jgi:hypothetical protein